MLRKLTTTFAVAFLLTCLLAGCGGGNQAANTNNNANQKGTSQNQTDNGNKGKTGEPAEKTELKLWFYYEGKERFDKVAKLTQDFSNNQDAIHITPEYVPFDQFKKQLSVGMAADTLPDLVIIDNPDHAAYAAMGLFADVTEHVNAIEGIDQFFPGPMKSVTYEGKIYGLPFASNNIALYYNKKMLEDANVTVPQTWDELREAAKTLTNGNTKGFAISAPQNEEGTFQYLPWLLSAGGSPEAMDSNEAIHSLAFLTDLIKDGSMSKEVINWTQADVLKQFIAGRVAMMINGPWQIPELQSQAPDLKYGVALIPRDQVHASVLGGENIGVINGDKVDAAVQFLKYFAQPEVMKPFIEDFGNFPPRKDVADDPAWTEDPIQSVFSENMQYAMPRGPSPHWPELSNAISLALNKSLTEHSSPEASAQEAQVTINDINRK